MIRTFLAAVVLVVLTTAPAVQAQDPPRFFIERIEVRNTKRVSSDVIVAESRLREEAEYSEAELRDAAARLTRLPFLLNAEFALERGSERGRHVLVIHVIETRSFFFRFDIVPIFSEERVEVDLVSQLGSDQSSAALGYRWFIGRRGAFHVALVARDETEFTSGYSAFAAGYTRYDIFGTRAFATINVKDTPEGHPASPQLVVGIPLSLNQTLTAEYDENRTNFEVTSVPSEPIDDRMTQRIARLTWSYNTTNHPYLPTTGTLVSVTPLAIWRDDNNFIRFVPGPLLIVPVHTRTIGIQSTALQYYELTERTSISGGVEVGWGTSNERRSEPGPVRVIDDYTTVYGGLQTGISLSLWSAERRAAGGDSRVELTVRGRVRDDDRADDRLVLVRTDDDQMQASLTWVRHSSWGTLRFGAGWAW